MIATILKWTPLLGQGFALNVVMSVLAMAIGSAAGTLLGLAQISLMPTMRASRAAMSHSHWPKICE